MKYVLDTHILLWWYLDSSDLPSSYRQLIDRCEKDGEPVGISIITFWEIAQLVSRGRLSIAFSLDQWFSELEEDEWLQVIPLSGKIILESTRLGEKFHKDPADRLIVATARQGGLRLLTVDAPIRQSGVVSVV